MPFGANDPQNDALGPAVKDGEGIRRLLRASRNGGATDFELILPDRGGAYRRLEGVEGLAFGDVVDELEPERPHRASGIARRLICMGRVWTDIDILITEDSPVVVRPPADVSSALRRH